MQAGLVLGTAWAGRYCHLEHADRGPAHRPRKQTRDKYKQLAVKIIERHQEGASSLDALVVFAGSQEAPQRMHEELQDLALQSQYVRAFLSGGLSFTLTELQGYLDGLFPPEAPRQRRSNSILRMHQAVETHLLAYSFAGHAEAEAAEGADADG